MRRRIFRTESPAAEYRGETGDLCYVGFERSKIIAMLNFEEEISKFQPSLEIDEAEEAIFHNDLTDFSDIIETIVKSKSER